ncbi:MAG: EI24 domain-containing protein [Verrucomicrobiota bacterium]
MKDFWLGLKDYGRAHRLIWKEGIWKHMIVPGFLGVLYFPIVFGGVYSGSIWGLTEAGKSIGEKWIPKEVADWGGWDYFAIGAGIVTGAIGLYVAFLLFRSVLMIFYSPFIGFISEAAEKSEFGTSGPAFSVGGLLYDIYRGIMVSLVSLGLSLALTVLCWAFLLIPVAGAVVSFVGMLMVQAFFAGAGFVDPVLERRRYGIRRSLGFSARNKMKVMGNGAGFMLIVMVPIIGWFLAPTYGIVAAAVSGVESVESY